MWFSKENEHITCLEISLCITRSEEVLRSHKLLMCPRNLKNLMLVLSGFCRFSLVLYFQTFCLRNFRLFKKVAASLLAEVTHDSASREGCSISE